MSGVKSPNSLILFDIDATLVASGGLGVKAMLLAGQEMFSPAFMIDGIDFAGRIDPLLIREMMALNGVAATPGHEREFRQVYVRTLQRLFDSSTGHRPLPGANELVIALRDGRAGALGLLTGNFAESGTMKLQRCGIDTSVFVVSAWGDDSPHNPPDREHLPPVAIQRYKERFGREPDPGRVTIIGDTPHDVRCAKVNGCRVIGVATGRYSVAELERSGADWAVQDLTRTAEIVEWLA